MSCPEIRELFSDHLDGELAPEAEERLGRHVGACPACRDELARYEETVGALAGTSPQPPAELSARVARRLREEGLLTRAAGSWARGWWPLAAALVFLVVGLIVGRLTAPRDDEGDRGESRLSALAWGDTCAATPVSAPSLDPRRWRSLGPAEPDLTLTAGPHVLRLPRRLTSHGPYETTASVEQEGSTCVPLRAPLGTGLALSLRPWRSGEADEADAFVVEADPRRVLYGRVLWRQQGLTWSLEGRADATELLDLAREVAARVRVEKPGDRI